MKIPSTQERIENDRALTSVRDNPLFSFGKEGTDRALTWRTLFPYAQTHRIAEQCNVGWPVASSEPISTMGSGTSARINLNSLTEAYSPLLNPFKAERRAGQDLTGGLIGVVCGR